MNAMTAFPTKHPHLDGIVKTFDLAEEPVDLCLRHLNGSLDYGQLRFGVRYRALQSFTANRLGTVTKGEKLHFLGSYYFPYDNGLRLYFERADASKLILEFEGNFPDTPDTVRMIDDRNLRQFFAPVSFDLSKRTKRLAAARAIITHHQEGVSP